MAGIDLHERTPGQGFGNAPKRQAVLLGLLWAVFLAGCPSPDDRLETAKRMVADAVTRGDRGAALEALRGLRERPPEAPEAWLELADLYVQAGEAGQALWLLERGVERFTERHDLRLALAHVALLQASPSLARAVLEAVPTEAEEHPQALVLRAQAELALGRHEEALGVLATAERLYPDRPKSRLLRISVLLREGREEEARAALAEARAPRSLETEEGARIRRQLELLSLQLQLSAGETEDALASLARRVAADPGDVAAWQLRTDALLREDRVDEAVAFLDEALAAPDAPAALYRLSAQAHAVAGDAEAAEAALRRLAETARTPDAFLPLVDFQLARDDTAAALGVVEEALTHFPDDAALRRLRTEILLALERVEDARNELVRFREITFDGDPRTAYLEARLALAEGDAARASAELRALAPRLDDAATQYWLGRALAAMGDRDGAHRRYALASRRDPDWPAPPAARIGLAVQRGDWREAAAEAERLIRLAPGRLDAWQVLGEALENLGEGAAAEASARRAREHFPDREEPWLLLARALRVQGRMDEALAVLDEAREHFGPSAARVAVEIRTLGMAGRTAAGLDRAETALAAHPDAPELLAAKAALLYATGAAEAGDRAGDQALALAPEDPQPLRERCRFRTATSRFAAARTACTRYLEARPDDARVHFLLAVALEGLGETDAALDAYRRAAALDERDPAPLNNLAGLLAERGDLAAALVAAQEAYRLDEDNSYVQDTLGALYLEKGLVDRAISFLEEAHETAPNLPDAAFHLAQAYREAGRIDEARALLDGLAARGTGRPQLDARVETNLESLPQP